MYMCACLYVRANYLSMFRLGGQNRVLPRIRGEIDIERSENLGGASVTFGFLKNRRLAVSLRRRGLYIRNTSDRIRERTFSTSTSATVELTPWCTYVYTPRRYGTSGEVAVGRAATRFRLQIPLAVGVSFVGFFAELFRTAVNSLETTFVDLTECTDRSTAASRRMLTSRFL